MKIINFCFFLFLSNFLFGNMAKPWVDGSDHSVMFANSGLSVTHEHISIDITQNSDGDYASNYTITYHIFSEKDGIVPFAFIGINLNNDPKIISNNINEKRILIQKNELTNFPFIKEEEKDEYIIKYDEKSEKSIELSDLIYFKTHLKKGNNTISISYKGYLKYNTYGLERAYTLNYALYPSKFWKSFGPIAIDLKLPDNVEIKNSNFKYTQNGNVVNFIINKISTDDFTIIFTKKKSAFAQLLLFLEPSGIAYICLFVLFTLHLVIIKKRKPNPVKKPLLQLFLETLLISFMVYTIYFISFPFIDFFANEHNKNGYIFLMIFTLPFFILFYFLIISLINYFIKKLKS